MADPARHPDSDDRAIRYKREATTRIPRGVKVAGIVVAVLALLIVIAMLGGGGGGGGGGGHGPSRHF